jgi:hypothetical protein
MIDKIKKKYVKLKIKNDMNINKEFKSPHEQVIQVDPISNKFSPNFKENLLTNPTYNAVYEMLLQGVDEYTIIEELLKINEQQSNAIIKLQENQQPKYFLRPE